MSIMKDFISKMKQPQRRQKTNKEEMLQWMVLMILTDFYYKIVKKSGEDIMEWNNFSELIYKEMEKFQKRTVGKTKTNDRLNVVRAVRMAAKMLDDGFWTQLTDEMEKDEDR